MLFEKGMKIVNDRGNVYKFIEIEKNRKCYEGQYLCWNEEAQCFKHICTHNIDYKKSCEINDIKFKNKYKTGDIFYIVKKDNYGNVNISKKIVIDLYFNGKVMYRADKHFSYSEVICLNKKQAELKAKQLIKELLED